MFAYKYLYLLCLVRLAQGAVNNGLEDRSEYSTKLMAIKLSLIENISMLYRNINTSMFFNVKQRFIEIELDIRF